MFNGNRPTLMGVRRKSFLSVGLAWRIPLALLISFLIMLKELHVNGCLPGCRFSLGGSNA